MGRANQNMQHIIQPCTVAHRGRIKDLIRTRGRIHIGKIAQRDRYQHAMGDLHSLGLPRGARGIKQPGQILWMPLHGLSNGCTAHSLPIAISRDRHHRCFNPDFRQGAVQSS